MYVRDADAARSSRRCASPAGCSAPGEYEHAYPHCWRCDTPLLYYAKTSWYVRTTAVKDELLAANETIDWYPEHIKHGRFGNWLENNVDWALSRERYWGTPLPIWRCDDEPTTCVCVGSLDELARARRRRRPTTCTGPTSTTWCCACDDCGGEMRRVPELIDVWWDSGCMPFAQWHAPFENEDDVRAALPGRLHLRGARPDARLVLLAARGLDAAVRPVARYKTVPLPRPDPRPRGPEDVQVAGATSSCPGTCSTPTARTPSAGTTSPRSSRGTATASRSRPSASRVRQFLLHALEHLRLLRPLRERRTASSAAPTGERDGPRPLDPVAPGGDRPSA